MKNLLGCIQGEERKDHIAAWKGDLARCPAKDWPGCSGKGKLISLESKMKRNLLV